MLNLKYQIHFFSPYYRPRIFTLCRHFFSMLPGTEKKFTENFERNKLTWKLMLPAWNLMSDSGILTRRVVWDLTHTLKMTPNLFQTISPKICQM